MPVEINCCERQAHMDRVQGTIFDIQRFALHDGPGIRTTVFLKGCPLRCIWCHNPESQDFNPQLSFDRAKCTDCFRCVKACPAGAHKVVDGRHVADHGRCCLSAKCVEACPNGALKIIGRKQSVREVMDVVIRDIAYYNNSGGGMTISGGEPMSQFRFTLELLKAAKEKGIHTCLDTSGYAPGDLFERVLPYTDLFLYDYKATDDKEHLRLTGVSNRLILDNLDLLYRAGASIILRCPLVKGINDTDEHFMGIAEIDRKYPGLAGIELMAYHNMGHEKYERIGRKPEMEMLPTTDEATKESWLERLKAFGCGKAIIG